MPITSYVRTQGAICAIINVVLNPLLAWIAYRKLEVVPVWGATSVVVDTAITSFVLPLLVALFVTPGAHRALLMGQIKLPDAGLPRRGRLLSHLPAEAWRLGILFGAIAAVFIVPLIIGLSEAFDLAAVTLPRFAVFKALYTGLLGFIVTSWVIRRQLFTTPVHRLAQP